MCDKVLLSDFNPRNYVLNLIKERTVKLSQDLNEGELAKEKIHLQKIRQHPYFNIYRYIVI